MIIIFPGNIYRIKDIGRGRYFEEKYGTPTPEIRIEDRDVVVFGKPWHDMNGNSACLQFAFTSGAMLKFSQNNLLAQAVYYGKVRGLGELVWASELEEELHAQPL